MRKPAISRRGMRWLRECPAVAVLETIALDSSRRRHLIDQALARAGMRRLDSSALAAELEPELPPDLDFPS
jgi:hypothetical protein